LAKLQKKCFNNAQEGDMFIFKVKISASLRQPAVAVIRPNTWTELQLSDVLKAGHAFALVHVCQR
jgi:hypothetical protein